MPDNKKRLYRLLAIIPALCVWQLAAMAVGKSYILASPVEVLICLSQIWREPGFWGAIGFSLAGIMLGFLLGLTAGAALAALANRYPLAELLLWPFMATVRAVPVASFIVICLLWLSAARVPVLIAFLIVLPVVYGSLLEGLRSGDAGMRELAQVFGMSRWRRLVYIRLPELKPFITAACSTSLGMAWKAGVAAEIIGTPAGSIGREIYLAKTYLEADVLLCWTLVIVLLSSSLERLLAYLLRLGYGRLERGTWS